MRQLSKEVRTRSAGPQAMEAPHAKLPHTAQGYKLMHTLDLQAYSYQDRQGLLPVLTTAFTHCGGWVLERKTTSPTTIEFKIEIQLRGIVELYSSLIASGVELTRSAHGTLTDLCTCRYHVNRTAQPMQVISLRLELSFLEDVTLHSLMMTGSGLA